MLLLGLNRTEIEVDRGMGLSAEQARDQRQRELRMFDALAAGIADLHRHDGAADPLADLHGLALDLRRCVLGLTAASGDCRDAAGELIGNGADRLVALLSQSAVA